MYSRLIFFWVVEQDVKGRTIEPEQEAASGPVDMELDDTIPNQAPPSPQPSGCTFLF